MAFYRFTMTKGTPIMARQSAATKPAPPTPSRAQQRKRRIAELRAEAMQKGTTEQMFPTSEPYQFVVEPTANPMSSVLTFPLVTPSGPRSADPDGVVPEGPLAALAHEINIRLDRAKRNDQQAFDHRLAAAIQVAEAKRECEARKINFRAWSEASFDKTLAFITIRHLAIIGSAEDPRQALADWRERNKEANKRMRDRRALTQGENPFAPAPQQITGPEAEAVTEAPEAKPDPLAGIRAKLAEAVPAPTQDERHVSLTTVLADFRRLSEDERREFLNLVTGELD
jgi:hypothetical protein